MPKGQMPGRNQPDPMVIVVTILLLVMMVWILWLRFHTPLATAYSYIRMAEFGVFWLLGKVSSYLATPFYGWAEFFLQSDKSLIEWHHITASSFLVNLCILLLLVGPYAYRMVKRSLKNNPYNHLNYGKLKDYTLHTFTDTMAAVYPHLKLFRKLNLTAKPINHGKYRLADTAKQFAIKHNLLDITKEQAGEFKVNRERSGAVFRSQLGRPWTGFENLTRSEFAVVAALLPRIAATDVTMPEKDYKEALAMTQSLIRDYWSSAADSYDVKKDALQVDITKAKASVLKYRNHPNVQKFCNAHAYVATVIYRLVHECRVLGVLQPADFRWLRVTDRRLWLFVDNVGRIVSTTEISGIYAHFLHELHQKRAIERPQVDNAVLALTEAVDSFAFTETEVLEVKAIAEQVEKAKAGINVDGLQKETKTMFLTIGDVEGRLVEAALVGDDGKTVFSSRCRLDGKLTAGDQVRLGLSEEAVKKLRNEPLMAEDLRKRLLEACNGHAVCFFGSNAEVLVPGIERSAAKVVDLRQYLQTTGKADGETLEQAMQALSVSVDVAGTDRWSVAEGLRARAVWVELEKRRLIAEAEAAKAAAGQGK